MAKKTVREIDVDFDMDRSYTVEELINLLRRIHRRCGKNCTVRFDAGHNNVSLMVTPSRKVNDDNGILRFE